MSSLITSIPNAILFVLDPNNEDVNVPSYIDGELIAATETCVSIGTQTEIDGETQVSLIFDREEGDSILIFSGSIIVPTGTIAIVNSYFHRLLIENVQTKTVDINIYVNDSSYPSEVIVQVM